MKRFSLWAAFVAGLYVMQSSILPLLAYHGISANLLLLLTVSFAFLRGARYGVLMGFCAGLLQDLATGTFFGVDVFSYMSIGFVCGKFSDQVFKDQVFLPLLASIMATVANYFLLLLFMLLLGYRFQVAFHIQEVLLPMLCWQFLFAYPVHKATLEMDKYIKERYR